MSAENDPLTAGQTLFQEQHQQLMIDFQDEAKVFWAEIAEQYGLNPDTSLTSGEWFIDYSFLTVDKAFLCQRDLTANNNLMNAPVKGNA